MSFIHSLIDGVGENDYIGLPSYARLARSLDYLRKCMAEDKRQGVVGTFSKTRIHNVNNGGVGVLIRFSIEDIRGRYILAFSGI